MYQVLTFRKNKNLVTCISLFLLFSLSNLIFYTPLFSKPQNADGYLILQTKYRGLIVKIDGKFAGYTRPDAFLLPAGKHSLSVSHPDGDNWLVSDWVGEIVISANDTTSVKVSFDKTYSINSLPYDANVYSKNQFIGVTPVFVKLTDAEIETITLSKLGYRDTTFVIGKENSQNYQINMSGSDNITFQENAFLLKNKKRSNKRIITAVGLSVISGALALYFRSRADDNYDRYLSTGNPDDFNRFYDDAKKYDKYAAVSFGVFQVSFIFSFYFFLSQNK